MCGIIGTFGNNIEKYGNDLQLRIEENSLMSYRGPDHFDSVIIDNLNLFHSRLSIIDLSNESNQPFINEKYVFAYNGELYNYKELAKEERIPNNSDGLVFFHMLCKYGISCLNRLDGMWAFAFYNKETKELFLCRDRFGEKPLFVHRDKDSVVFGSQINYLEEVIGYNLDINFEQVNNYLFNGYRSLYKDPTQTFFKSINALLPGKVYSYKLKKDKLIEDETTYFNPYDKGEYKYNGIVEVKNVLIDTIGKRLRSDVPLAFCMSSGIDSNTVISIAKKIYNYDVQGFTIKNNDKRYDESVIVDQVVKELGIKHTYVDFKGHNFLNDLEDIIINNSAPLVTISYYMNWVLMREIAEQDYKVTLSGTGVDELFAGYYAHYLYNIAISQYYDKAVSSKILNDWKQHVFPILRKPHLFNDNNLFVDKPYFRDYLYFDKSYGEAFDHKADEFWEKPYSNNILKNRMLNELLHESIPCILHDDDLNSMYWSIENRSPFLSKDLFELSQRIPPIFFIKDGYNKCLIREAMQGIVPECVLNQRKKIGFNCSVFDLVSDFEFLLDWRNKIWNFYDLESAKVWFKNKNGNFNEEDSKFVFNLINVKIFLDIFG